MLSAYWQCVKRHAQVSSYCTKHESYTVAGAQALAPMRIECDHDTRGGVFGKQKLNVFQVTLHFILKITILTYYIGNLFEMMQRFYVAGKVKNKVFYELNVGHIRLYFHLKTLANL